jgi:aminoglycoside 3-N-acetyltransferase
MTLYEIIVKKMGINKGDKLYVSSDLRLLILEFLRNGLQFDLDIFINTLISEVGNNGTIVFPTFNWDFCKSKTFNYNTTPGVTGSIGNAALKRSDFKRTNHPIYSFAVWGVDQFKLTRLKNKGSFTSNSPFGYFLNAGFKLLLINVPYENSFTFIHYVEQKLNVSYRYNKKFNSSYIDEKNNKSYRNYYMFVRPFKRPYEHVSSKLRSDFISDGVSQVYTYNENVFELIDLKSASAHIENDILNNKSRKILRFIDET